MKKVIASLTVCCLLFGSLSLSSCSSKNSPVNRDSDRAFDSAVNTEKKAESTKDLAWLKSPFVTSFAAMFVSDLIILYVVPMPKVIEKIGKYEEEAKIFMACSPLVVFPWNMYYTYSNYGSLWSGLWQSFAGTLAGFCVASAVPTVVDECLGHHWPLGH